MSPVPGTSAATAPNDIPTARAFRGLMRRMRRASSATRPWGELLQDLYVTAFSSVMVVALTLPVLQQGLRSTLVRAAGQHVPSRLGVALGVTLALAAAALLMRALTLVGPLVRDPADASWVLATPVDRAGLLWPAAVRQHLVTAVAGAIVGAVAATLAETGQAAGALAGAAAAVLVSAAALSAQRQSHGSRIRAGADAGLALAVLVLVLGLTGLLGRLPSPPSGAAVVVAVLLAATALAAAASTRRVVGQLRRPDLLAGAGLATGLRATVTSLDASFLAETMRTKRLLELGTVPVRALRGSGPAVLVAADLRRVLRWPRTPLLVLLSCPVVPVAEALYGGRGAVVAMVLLAWAAASGTSAGLRAISRSTALTRGLPWRDPVLRAAHCVVPTIWALAVTGGACLVAGLPGWWALAGALVGVAASLRTAAGRPPIRWETLVSTPAGAMPAGAVTSLLVGLDAAFIASLPWLLGARPTVSVMLPLAAVAVLVQWNRTPH